MDEHAENVVLSCGTCRIPLTDGERLKAHYKSDWHSYNLKRKIVQLPPLTIEEYASKINKLKSNESTVSEKKTTYSCKECKKTFSSKSTYIDHQNSKKHKENVENSRAIHDNEPAKNILPTNTNEIEIEEEVDSDEWDDYSENPIDSNQCLFCTHQSDNFDANLEHMCSIHSFFIPDIEYCTDIMGLLTYLGEKVGKYYMCLWCNEKGRSFYSIGAARDHMIDKGHCMMLYEGVALTEYVDFYDYTSSYPDAEKAQDEDEEVPENVLDGSDYQLVLPSGITVGHRSLMRYYKQSASRSTALVPSKNNAKLHKVLATYRALGWSQSDQEKAARTSRDIHFLKRVQSKWYTKMGVKNNKFQKHFRQQVNY